MNRGFVEHCHFRTHAVQQKSLFDYLVSAPEQCDRERDAEGPGSLEIDRQLDFRGLHDRQVGCPLALENPAGVDADLAMPIRLAGSVAHQATSGGKLPHFHNCGNPMACCQFGELLAAAGDERIGTSEDCSHSLLDNFVEGRVNVVFGADVQDHDLPPKRACGIFCFSNLEFGGRLEWVHEKANCADIGNGLTQHLQPLRHKPDGEYAYAGDIATWAVQVGNKPELHRVGASREDNWNG